MENSQIIREIVLELFSFLDIKPEILIETSTGRTRVNVSVDEAGFLIGRDGENLKTFQHILALMIGKKTGDFLSTANFIFDINNYQKEREDYLTALTKNTAYRVLETKKAEELPPMSPAERKIIHLVVEQIGGVRSESVGEGEERRVVIKPENF